AMDELIEELTSTGVLAGTDPTIVILATGGVPGRCGGNVSVIGSSASRAAAVTAVADAYGAGVRTFVLAVNDETQLASGHVNALANAGVGDASGTTKSADSWRVNSLSALQDAIGEIVQGEISCTLHLEGQVTNLEVGCNTGHVSFVG